MAEAASSTMSMDGDGAIAEVGPDDSTALRPLHLMVTRRGAATPSPSHRFVLKEWKDLMRLGVASLALSKGNVLLPPMADCVMALLGGAGIVALMLNGQGGQVYTIDFAGSLLQQLAEGNAMADNLSELACIRFGNMACYAVASGKDIVIRDGTEWCREIKRIPLEGELLSVIACQNSKLLVAAECSKLHMVDPIHDVVTTLPIASFLGMTRLTGQRIFVATQEGILLLDIDLAYDLRTGTHAIHLETTNCPLLLDTEGQLFRLPDGNVGMPTGDGEIKVYDVAAKCLLPHRTITILSEKTAEEKEREAEELRGFEMEAPPVQVRVDGFLNQTLVIPPLVGEDASTPWVVTLVDDRDSLYICTSHCSAWNTDASIDHLETQIQVCGVGAYGVTAVFYREDM